MKTDLMIIAASNNDLHIKNGTEEAAQPLIRKVSGAVDDAALEQRSETGGP